DVTDNGPVEHLRAGDLCRRHDEHDQYAGCDTKNPHLHFAHAASHHAVSPFDRSELRLLYCNVGPSSSESWKVDERPRQNSHAGRRVSDLTSSFCEFALPYSSQ